MEGSVAISVTLSYNKRVKLSIHKSSCKRTQYSELGGQWGQFGFVGLLFTATAELWYFQRPFQGLRLAALAAVRFAEPSKLGAKRHGSLPRLYAPHKLGIRFQVSLLKYHSTALPVVNSNAIEALPKKAIEKIKDWQVRCLMVTYLSKQRRSSPLLTFAARAARVK